MKNKLKPGDVFYFFAWRIKIEIVLIHDDGFIVVSPTNSIGLRYAVKPENLGNIQRELEFVDEEQI